MSTFEGPCWIPPGKSTLRLISAAEKSFPLRSCFQWFPGLLAGSKPMSLEMSSLTLLFPQSRVVSEELSLEWLYLGSTCYTGYVALSELRSPV